MAVQILVKWSYFLRNPVVRSTRMYTSGTDRTIIPPLAAFGNPVPHVRKEQLGSTSGLPNGRGPLHYDGDTRTA